MVGSNLIDTKQVTHVKRRLFNHAQSVLSLGFSLFVWLLKKKIIYRVTVECACMDTHCCCTVAIYIYIFFFFF